MWPWFWGSSYAWRRYGYAYPYSYGYPCGYGYPYGFGWPWAMSKEQEIAMLEDQQRCVNGELDAIRKRLEELNK